MNYQKPRYDPFETFLPTKTFIRDKIRELKQQAYELQPCNHPLRHEHGFTEIIQPELEQQHAKLCSRINEYVWRMRNDNKPNQCGGRRITPVNIENAKKVPIEDFYSGKLRKSGKTFVGRCPFHEEKTGSFTIYSDNNRFVCFGCGEKGDSIDFVMKLNGLKFIEAVKYILKNEN